MLELDGAELTGGGQIVRTALGLSAYTNKPFRIKNVRAGRPRPGLRPQHLEAVKVLGRLCNADVTDAYVGSTSFSFVPRGFTPQPLDVHIGTAGSVSLLAQALCLPSMHHKKTKYVLHGGTDVRWSPPVDYLRYVIAPTLQHFGEYDVSVRRRGYYPRGGGSIECTWGLHRTVKPVSLLERGVLDRVTAVISASRSLLDKRVVEDVERDLRFFLADLDVPVDVRSVYSNTVDDGYSVVCYATHLFGGERRSCLGADVLGDEVNNPGEAARRACTELKELLAGPGVVDEHVADHLIPFLSLHGGEFLTSKVSGHVRAAIHVCEAFTDTEFRVRDGVVRSFVRG